MKIFLSLYLFCLPLFAQTLVITESHTYNKASPYMEYVKDSHNTFTPENIHNAPWQKLLSPNLDAFTSQSSWTRFKLHNDSSKPKQLILKNPNASMCEIDVYIFQNNRLIHTLQLGDNRPITLREIPHRYSVFPITLQAGETVEILTRLFNTIGLVEGEWEVYSRQEFTDFSVLESMWWGGFIGVFSLLFLYVRPILSIINHKPVVFSFTFFATSCLVYQLSINGILYSFGINEIYIDTIIIFFGSMFRLATVFILLNLLFIQQKKNVLWWAFSTFMFFLSLVFVLSFILFFKPEFISIIGKTSVIIELCSYSIWFLMVKEIFSRTRKKVLTYIVLAYTVILIPNGYQSLISLGLMPTNFISIYSVSVASIFNIYLFSLAILEYIRTIEEEKNHQEKLNEIHMHYGSIGKIIGNIAHQWKVPLVRTGSLLTQTEALINLQPHNALEEIRTYIVPALRTNLDFMQETIDTFYTLYKGEDHASTFAPEKVLHEIWGMLSAKAVTLNCKLQITIKPHMLINTYQHHFGHLLMILLDNAIDTAKERNLSQSLISVTIAQDEASLYISIEDTCGGIAQRPLESIFDLDVSSKSDDIKDRGRGLYIFKTLLDIKFCGSVHLSNTQHGAKFDITLPLLSKS